MAKKTFTCVMEKKSAHAKLTKPTGHAKATGDAFGLVDNEDGSFTVYGKDAAGHGGIDLTEVAALAVSSSDVAVLTVDSPIGMTCATHGVAPGMVVLSIVVTWNNSSIGPFNIDLTGTVSAGKVTGLDVVFTNPVPRP